jgi:hypothetical protein
MTGLWIGVILVSSVALVFTASGLDYALERVWRFQRRRLGWSVLQKRSGSTPQLFERFQRKPRFQASLTEIRDFIVNLQLATSMNQTLSVALVQAAEQLAEQGMFGKRLKQHVESRLVTSPEEVIRGLAEDFGSDQLNDVLRRLEAARDGRMSTVEALSLSVATIEENIRTDIEREIQQAPNQLGIGMMAGVFGPALFLSTTPLVIALLRQLGLVHFGS